MDQNRLAEYVSDIIKNKYALAWFDHKYGAEQCRLWRQDPHVKNLIEERRKELSSQGTLLLEQWNNLRGKSFDIISSVLDGDPTVTPEQASMARWILSGEKSYIEARAKALGEKAADLNTIAREPLRIIKDDGNKATESPV